jgi:transposase
VNVIGVDAHKHTHTLVAVDAAGVEVGEKTVAGTSVGHAEALRWVFATFGTDCVWGVEDSRVYTALLEHDLLAAGQTVVRVPPHLMARTRRSARTWGKSDPIDALATARTVLREPDLPSAYHDKDSWELKLLVDRREDLVGQRTATINRLIERLHLIDPSRAKPSKLHLPGRRTALGDYLQAQPGLPADLARGELVDIAYFTDRSDELARRIGTRVHHLGCTLVEIPGCAELVAAKLIGEAANVDRFRSEAAFARFAGVAPVPMWSGTTRGRMRMTRGGNRQINVALHRIAVVQIGIDGPGRDYYRRRLADGDSPMGALRSLRRRVCRVVYTRLRADYERRQHHQGSLTGTVVTAPAWAVASRLGDRLAAESQAADTPGQHLDAP